MSSFLAKGLPDTFQSEVDILYHVSLFSTLFCKILTLSATIFQELNFTFLSFQWFVFGFEENYYATRATKLHFCKQSFIHSIPSVNFSAATSILRFPHHSFASLESANYFVRNNLYSVVSCTCNG